MKSIKLVANKKFGIFEEEKPVPDKQNNVLIKIASVGVCGSDMHYYKQGKIGEDVVKFPFTLGHEASGYIEEIIGESGDLKIGQLVAIDPSLACDECDQCLAGRHHTCRNNIFIGGAAGISGLSKEYAVVPAKNVFPVPENFSANEAAFVEPMSIGTYAAKLGRTKPNENIGIIGVGPIGMSTLISLRYYGCNNLFVWDKLDYRLDIAKSAGAEWTGNPDKINIQTELKKVLPDELDKVFECCGEQEAVDLALKVLKPGGKLIIVGIPEEDRISFDMNLLRRKEIDIINVRRQNDSMIDAIKVLEKFKELNPLLMTHTFNYQQTEEAFKVVSEYADNVVKAFVTF